MTEQTGAGNHAPDQPEMPLIEHLLELRNRLLKMVLAVVVCFAFIYPFANELYLWLSEPIRSLLPVGQSMIATDVTSPFFAPLKLALVLAVFAAIPVILYQLWSFIAPGLYAHEKKIAFPLLFSSVLLFYLGAAFAYYVVFPLVFGFFTAVGPEGIVELPDITSYLNFVLKMFFAFGVAFEIPIATILLIITGVTTPDDLAAKRPYVVVGCFVIGMMLTPPDIISQTLLALPMWILFELGILFGRLMKRKVAVADEAKKARQRMNLALLFTADFISTDTVRLGDRRLEHLRSIRKIAVGDSVPVGLVNGNIGVGRVTGLTEHYAELQISLDQAPPKPLPLTLMLAMPRPKMFRRTLQTCATLGVKDLWLINSYKVEKSFWQTPWLQEPALHDNLVLGLEQARDTLMPKVHIRKLFKPFVEDELPALLAGKQALVAHPGSTQPCPVHLQGPAALCIGPEGGFTDYEVDKLQQAGCQAVHLGQRILRVETAVPVLVSRLFDGCA